MLHKKLLQIGLIASLGAMSLTAGEFNKQAEVDRKALIQYFEDKFENPEKNRYNYFPYSTDQELKSAIAKGLKHQDFAKGNYAYNIDGKAQYEEMREMPPYEELVENGETLWNKPFKNGKSLASCLGNPADVSIAFPYFDDKRNQVVTLTQAINECLVDNGEKKLNTKKGAMAHIQAFIAQNGTDEEKVINVEINSQAAADAYERGKKYYYTQRGYLKLNCAECHVQGAGKRVRNEKLSQLLGHTTHFPVYRLKWGAKKTANGLGTLERRMSGCIKDQGQIPPKDMSNEMKELLYFMSYMNNGMKIDGPDIRK